MHLSTTLLSAGLASVALAAYTIQDDYSGNNFFSLFTFDTFDDPTHGYVNYVDGATAQSEGLTSVSNGIVTIRSDSTNIASGHGRNSVRLTSTKQYTHGLVVIDLAHMPGSACGVWPAFWMTGPNWPNQGEIDILEGVNRQTQNAFTLHTSPGCTQHSQSCQGSTGCSVPAGGPSSFGDGFNNAGGGVYAMRWTSSAIDVWFFSRGSVPEGVLGDHPDPSAWGEATVSFQGGDACNIDDHFRDNHIVINTAFCGDWAGAVFGQDATCASKAATCQDYVRDNPAAFGSAYWTINSLKVYTETANTKTKARARDLRAVSLILESAAADSSPISMPAAAVIENSTSDPKTANEEHLPETEDANVHWAGTTKKYLSSPFSSSAEQLAVTKNEDGEVQIKRGSAGRHFKRRAVGHGHGRHS